MDFFVDFTFISKHILIENDSKDFSAHNTYNVGLLSIEREHQKAYGETHTKHKFKKGSFTTSEVHNCFVYSFKIDFGHFIKFTSKKVKF